MAIKVFNHWGNLNSIVGNGLGQNSLVGLVSDERTAVLVKHETSWLSASRECNLHLSLVHLVNISVCADSEEVTLGVLGGAVERHGQLEKFFKVSRRSVCH